MKKLPLLIIATLIYSCTSNNVYINQEPDNDEAKIFLNKFYKKIVDKNFEAVDSMVGDSLKQLAGTNGISKMVKFINNKVGNYKSYTIDDYYIRCIIGDNNQISYNYKLKVIYDKGIIDEIIGFRKQNGLEIKINSYHANSDLLIH